MNNNNHISIYFIPIIFLIISSCVEEPFPKYNFPHITTLDASNISESGVVFNAEIKTHKINDIKKTGFIWGLHNYYGDFFDTILLNENTNIKSFSLDVHHALPKGKEIYYSAFAKTSDFIVYGNIKSFKSVGCSLPVFNEIKPDHGSSSDTIIIIGDNFTGNTTQYNIKINDFFGRIIKAEKTAIMAKIPNYYDSPGPATVQLKMYDIWYDVGIINLDTLKILEVTPKSGRTFIDKIEILTNTRVYSVSNLQIGNTPIDYLYINNKKITFKIPKNTPSGNFTISGKINNMPFSFDKKITVISPWTQKSDCPKEHGITTLGFPINGKAYYYIPVGLNSLPDEIWEYNPTTDEWKLERSVHDTRDYEFSFTLNGYGYWGAGLSWEGNNWGIFEYSTEGV